MLYYYCAVVRVLGDSSSTATMSLSSAFQRLRTRMFTFTFSFFFLYVYLHFFFPLYDIWFDNAEVMSTMAVVGFYPAMLCIVRTMLSQDVCLSDTRRYSVETVQHIVHLFSPLCLKFSFK